MKIISPLPKKHGRLEIIPLIDIMFFLLAAFMLVSLQRQHLLSIKADLPTATMATAATKPALTTLTVDRFGQVAIDGQPATFPELDRFLKGKLTGNANWPVYIQGHWETTHGSIVGVLDFVRRAGISKVAIAVKTMETMH
ncbi:MAG: biopolymer transporter ExbD [Verrucomicrobiota bacterium]